MLTAVVDTNILINGLLKGSCRPILEAFLERKFQLAISRPLIEELLEVCLRPKFSHRIDEEDKRRLLAIIKEAAMIVKPTIKIHECRDKDDNIVLECAITSKADIIVTKDSDLSDLNPFRRISIVGPNEFLSRLRKQS